MNKTIRTFYFKADVNFGDLINPLITRYVSGCELKWTINQNLPFLLSTGSLMTAAVKTTIIWGTGVMSKTIGTGPLDPENIYLLRGKLSQDYIHVKFGVRLKVPHADPSIILPEIFPFTKEKKYKLGYIPHYVDTRLKFTEYLRKQGVLIIESWDVLTYLEKMNMCENIISSSLHGCIIADAYDIPNKWITVSDKVVGKGFKFRDYYSSTHEPAESTLDLRENYNEYDIYGLIDKCAVKKCRLSIKELKESFPFHRLNEITI